MVCVWDLESGLAVSEPIRAHHLGILVFAMGERSGHKVVVSGSSDGTVRLWDLESGDAAAGPLRGHDGWVRALAVGERSGGAR